jgi:hypothetical protein
MLLYILEVYSSDLDPETFYSNRNTRSFCLVRVGTPRHLHVPIFFKNLGTSTSWTPQGLSKPVMGLPYLYMKEHSDFVT